MKVLLVLLLDPLDKIRMMKYIEMMKKRTTKRTKK